MEGRGKIITTDPAILMAQSRRAAGFIPAGTSSAARLPVSSETRDSVGNRLLLLLRFRIGAGAAPRHRPNGRQRHIQRRQLLLPRQRWQRIEFARFHAHKDRLLDAAAIDAFVRRHVGEVAAHATLMKCSVTGQSLVGSTPTQPKAGSHTSHQAWLCDSLLGR